MERFIAQLRVLIHDEKAMLELVRKTDRGTLLRVHDVIGIGDEPGSHGRKKKTDVHDLAELLPISVHWHILFKLWPKLYREKWAPQQPMNVTTAAEAVRIMELRAEENVSLRHPHDEVEITDRTRLFHRQKHQYVKDDSAYKKPGKRFLKENLSKRMLQSAAYHGDEEDQSGISPFHRKAFAPPAERHSNRQQRCKALQVSTLNPEDRAKTVLTVLAKLKAIRAAKAKEQAIRPLNAPER